MVLTQAKLDRMTCSDPDCAHIGHEDGTLWLHGACHPDADLGVCYTKATGLLTVFCSECSEPVAEIAVAQV